MAGKKRENVRDEDITGLKFFDKLLPLFEPLHAVGCQRDKAGNRQLHYDEYCLLLRLFLFNPIVTSLRGLQQASELKKVQRKLRCKRASLGSLSESVAIFDPELLKRIIDELGGKLEPIHNVGRGHVKHALTAIGPIHGPPPSTRGPSRCAYPAILDICPPPSSPQRSLPNLIPNLLAHPRRLCNNRAEQDWDGTL